MDPTYLGMSAVGWKIMVGSWWDKVIAGFLLTMVALGSLYILYKISSKIVGLWKARHHQAAVSSPIARKLNRLKKRSSRLSLMKKHPKDDLNSFGVFLGRFEIPATDRQKCLLSKWDVLVLDPLQEGVWEALSSCQSPSQHTLGRLDVQQLTGRDCSSSNDEIVQSLSVISEALCKDFQKASETESRFTGVLLAGFQTHFQPAVLNELVNYIRSLGLDVWLEMTAPSFLTEWEGRDINMESIRGLVCRNGTIRTDGDRQNYHQMSEMRTTMRAVAAQRVSHGPPFMMWETIDDGVALQYAVVQRSYDWCRYNSALCWIGPASALTNAEAAAEHTVGGKPLGALMWLKGEDNMKAHDLWRSNSQVSLTPCGHDALYDSLHSFIPDLATRLQLCSPGSRPTQIAGDGSSASGSRPTQIAGDGSSALGARLGWLPQPDQHLQADPLSISAAGDSFTGLGCFHLGLEVSYNDFAELLQAQRHLKDLNLLRHVEGQELQQVIEQLVALQIALKSHEISPTAFQAVTDLLEFLKSSLDDGDPRIQVYVGLHSGFQTSSEVQFLGLYDDERNSGAINLYISGRSPDLASTILHTFLSSRGCTRTECFQAELVFSEENMSLSVAWRLPPRLVSDIEHLSPTETVLFLQRLTSWITHDDSLFLTRVRSLCEHRLLDIPTLSQLRSLGSTAYLGGDVSAQELVQARISWLQQRGAWCPDLSSAIAVFELTDTRLHEILMKGQNDILSQLSVVIRSLLQRSGIDAGADIFALSVFSAFRKLALDEIYLEVLDRNPFPNHSTDQAGCFAENFALGSRCDSFFDMTPKGVGRIISSRYRAYYMKHQPPRREEVFTELPTTYAGMQVDLDPQYGQSSPPWYYRITFLGIFAVPALIDIMLLTTIGRGLYLTTFMSSTEKTMATTALMLALLACGAIGSWISTGGCYYLYANAFPAMNMFVLTRFVAGVAIVLMVVFGGMLGLAVVRSITAALIFSFYFTMLTIYLLALSALSIYQVPGTSFQSGRSVIMTRIPILFISPVLSLWIQHDIAVYLCVLTIFLVSLLHGTRKIMTQWTTWYLRIPCVTDAEVVKWYLETRGAPGPRASLAKRNEDLGMSPVPRQELHAAVLKECDRHFWMKSSKDPLVSRLAEGYFSTVFIMGWYCKFKRSRMPLPYSATWNLTLKAGLENMTNMQKGLKLHSAFLHWRHTGADIWSGVLYFVVALLDKWTALVSGGNLVGLSAASSAEYRLAVGFGLCYYLIGAVSLDAVSQPLWTAANQNTDQPITSLQCLRDVTINDKKARQALYWKNLVKFFFLHVWGAAITSALMWTFEGSRSSTILYLSYVGAYSGLLWYQYNKIYCGNDAARCLGLATIIGLPAGVALHLCLPHFAFSGVASLAIGTWAAALHSIYISRIGLPVFFRRRPGKPNVSDIDCDAKEKPESYSCSALEPYPEFSQATLTKSVNYIGTLPPEHRYRLDPSQHPGARIVEILLIHSKMTQPSAIQGAFPSAEYLLQRTAELWTNGQTVVELVSARHMPQQEQKVRALKILSNDRLYLFVGLGLDTAGDAWTSNIHRNCRIIAEALVQATCEMHLGLSRDHSMLAELLVVDHSGREALSIPEGVQTQLQGSSTERLRCLQQGRRTLLRHLLLGVDSEREWDQLPEEIRAFLLKRCYGQIKALPAEHEGWIRSRIFTTDPLDVECFLARSVLGAMLTTSVTLFARLLDPESSFSQSEEPMLDVGYDTLLRSLDSPAKKEEMSGFDAFKHSLSRFYQRFRTCIKFLVISLTADPEYQRELDYIMSGKPLFLKWPITFFLNGIWSFCKILQGLILPVVLLHGRENISRLANDMKHIKTVVEKHRITIESLDGPSTCFLAPQSDGSSRLTQYSGRHEKEPEDSKHLLAINSYTEKFILRQREEYRGQDLVNLFAYEYPKGKKRSQMRLPLQRQCLRGDVNGEIVHYDHRGYITTGSTYRGVNPVRFTYWYRKSAKFEDELLRGEYVFPHITIRVSWSMPPRNHPDRLEEWIPFTKVTEATFIEGLDVYHASWAYEHKFHPEISTTLNGKLVGTPEMIRDDWFKVLKKPSKCGFLSDNPLLSFSSGNSSFVSRRLGLNVKRYPIPTSHARTQLWKTWRQGKELDAITARWLDERILRSDASLAAYWLNRDLGRHDAAKRYLDAQADTIMARTDIDPEISSWVHIAFKISDFYDMGQGGDSRINTRTLSTQLRDTDDELHILAMDTSTWPNEPGGVSACRRDMVNDLKTIKWHIVAESANDYGVPRFQIERNVQSLTVLPLWGLDFLNPTHGVLENSLDSAVVQRSYDTNAADVEQNFLPILTSLVRCSRAVKFNRHHIEEATRALVDLNTYFESSRNWNDVWNSDIVKQTWRELWLTEDDAENTLPASKWWDFEKPTIFQLDQALNMWHRYLFIFSVPVPEKIPEVFQASHHFTGATYGILCKIKRQCTLHVWDHCISFRELTTFLASAVSFDSPFVNSSLISLGHLSCVLLEHHADVVLPCAAYFNPGWEVELGTAEGVLEHRQTFARKIDPVVNGICNMEKFEPIKTIKTSTPTVVMLSHVQYVKDIKNAIMATDFIVNKWGFTDYRLHVYGDMERAAGISAECQELIASKGLREHCILKGLGNPSVVLQDAWLFLNSSISEGLPLAMGEAALTGVPVVCTDVGASFCVVTDSTTGDRFSEVVPPNDAESLARAQISILALLGRWSTFAEDAPGTTAPVLAYPTPTPEQVQQISRRIYEKQEHRRRLGMLGRENVLKNFSSERYLREHEQMLWIGKFRSRSYRDRRNRYSTASSLNNSTTWSNKEKSGFDSSVTLRPRVPRLAPESWVSLSDASTLRSSSASSLKGWLKEKSTSRYSKRYTQTLFESQIEEITQPNSPPTTSSADVAPCSSSDEEVTDTGATDSE